jgi:hypothetical protein
VVEASVDHQILPGPVAYRPQIAHAIAPQKRLGEMPNFKRLRFGWEISSSITCDCPHGKTTITDMAGITRDCWFATSKLLRNLLVLPLLLTGRVVYVER